MRAYVKNQSLGFEVPYLLGSTPKRYLPDFIVQIDDGRDDPLNLIVEIKGYRGEDAKEKATTSAFKTGFARRMDKKASLAAKNWAPGESRLVKRSSLTDPSKSQ